MRSKQQTGFTIVELLIVIVVIAILAAITVVAYNGIQKRATETANFATIRSYMQAFQLMKAEKGSLPEGSNSNASCLGLTCTTILGTSTAPILGQIPSEVSTTATKSLLAEYGLIAQPEVKGGQTTHLVYTASYFGEPALLWSVAPSQDCTPNPGRFHTGSNWVDGIKKGGTNSTMTWCTLSLRDI